MKIFIAAAAAALITAPAAQAVPFTDDEIGFLNDLAAVGIVNANGATDTVQNGWVICGILYQGYSRSWVAQQIYQGSREANGDAGLPYSAAQALVFYANADLCPGAAS